RPDGTDLNQAGGLGHLDLDSVAHLSRGSVLNAVDLDFVLVPAGNLDRAIEIVDREPGARFQRVRVLEILLKGMGIPQRADFIPVASGQRCRESYEKQMLGPNLHRSLQKPTASSTHNENRPRQVP